MSTRPMAIFSLLILGVACETGVAQLSEYKEYFDITEVKTLIGLLFLALVMLLSTLAGISGNVVVYPVMLIFFNFNPHVAVGHTSFYCALSALVRIFVETFKTGSTKSKRINFDVVLLSCTPSIFGTFLGAFLNQISPDSVILLCTIVLLSTLTFMSFRDYRIRASKEKNALIEKEEGQEFEMKQMGRGADEKKEEMQEIEKLESHSFSFKEGKPHSQYDFLWQDAAFYLMLFFLNPFVTLLRGNKFKPSIIGINKCGFGDISIIVCYCASLIFISVVLKRQIVIRNKNVGFHDDNVDFSGSSPDKVKLIMILVGFVGSFLSAGASALITFSLIYLKMTPFTASPTSLLIGVVFGFSASFIFFLEGLLFSQAIVFGGLVVICATLGTRLTIYEAFLKQGKGSMILLFISNLTAISMLSAAFQVGPVVWRQYTSGSNIFKFKSLC